MSASVLWIVVVLISFVQLADKVKLLKTLYDRVQELKAGEAMDSSGMGIIPLPVMETAAEQSKLLST